MSEKEEKKEKVEGVEKKASRRGFLKASTNGSEA